MEAARGALIDERFRLVARVGEGGMGAVWAARDVAGDRDVALKILKAAGEDQLRRLLREARIAQRLQHPNVVRVDEILAPSAGAPVLVMELLRGESLRERLARVHALSVPEAARVVLDATDAVRAAHALAIVHRDLKPENVFLHHDDTSGRVVVKVLDFGIAKLAPGADLATGSKTKTGAMLGTPHYMAPEQVFGEGDVDGGADVWALGVVLFELLAGARPFEGDNAGQIWKAITMGEAPSLRARVADAPSDLVSLVGRMIAREREERPALDEVGAVLARFACETLARAPRSSQRVPAARPSVDELGATVVAEHPEPEALLHATMTPTAAEMTPRPSEVAPPTKTRTAVAMAAIALAASLAVTLGMRSRGVAAAAEGGEARPAPVVAAVASATSASEPAPAVVMEVGPVSSAASPVTKAARTAGKAPAAVVPVASAPAPVAAPASSATSRLPGGVHGVSPY